MNYYITTKDNPFNPATQFKDWYTFDLEYGYNSAGLLMRVAKISDGLTEEENDAIIEQAIDFIVGTDPNYIKVTEDYIPPGGSENFTTS